MFPTLCCGTPWVPHFGHLSVGSVGAGSWLRPHMRGVRRAAGRGYRLGTQLRASLNVATAVHEGRSRSLSMAATLGSAGGTPLAHQRRGEAGEQLAREVA